jgi:hypothetical protein
LDKIRSKIKYLQYTRRITKWQSLEKQEVRLENTLKKGLEQHQVKW